MKSAQIYLLVLILFALLFPLLSCADIASPLEDFNWVLTRYGDLNNTKTPLEGTEVTARFDSKTKTVHGNGGTNDFGGKYIVDHLTLKITDITLTTLTGGAEKDAQEMEFIKELTGATSFIMDHGQLIIESGNARLYFKQTDKPLKTITKWGE